MFWGRQEKLSDVWLQLTARCLRSFDRSHSRHASPRPAPGWRPFALRPTYLSILGLLMLTMVVVLEALRRYTDRYGGLVFYQDTTNLSSAATFAYNYVPVIVALILVTFWSFIDFDVLRLEPYFQLSRPEGTPATTLFINYNFGQSFLTPLTSAKRGHWVVLLVSLLTVLMRIFLPALQSAVFELREISVLSDETMRTWPVLVDLASQAQWITAQEKNTLDFSALTSGDSSFPKTRSSKYAVAPVEIPTDDFRESTVWTLNQTIYWSELSCQDVMVNNNLEVTANGTTDGLPIISWNVTGVPLQQPGQGQQCTLDFQYSNIFFPSSDYVQIRYWEPVWTDNAFQSFTTNGCKPFDLYGILITVNATRAADHDTDDMSLSGVTFASSATLFACSIGYRKADAKLRLHANSSITSVDIHPGTTTNLTDDQFNIDEFQGFLAHRAPYTSDMLFFRINQTSGQREVTELPVISQEIGDLEPVIVLESSDVMTKQEFEHKVTRGVRQTFLLTMGRLFNLDEVPAVVPATRLTRQVTLAVVDFAALCSEVILGLGVIITLGLLHVYKTRENVLQSDPCSVAAMCSIVTDLFEPSNILADPRFEFHRYSTRQLRRLLRNCWLRWEPGPGPNGRRLAIVTSDGSPIQLDEQMRKRCDPMPHFLVIPFFIIEFLLLAAVITAMSLVVASLTRDGKFRHLTQSDSSFFQVVLSVLPSMVASAVGSLCTSIHRNVSILEPWVHLQRGKATAKASLSMNYSSQTPLAVLVKAMRDRHVLLFLISVACVANTALTVVAGGIFTQELTSSSLPTSSLFTNYSNSVFQQSDFAADFTEYDIIQTSITTGVSILPWTSANHSFVPIMIKNPDSDALYGANTLGIGADLACQELSIADNLVVNPQNGSAYWEYQTFDDPGRQCKVDMTLLQHPQEDVTLSIHFLSPVVTEDEAYDCQTSTVVVLGRWNYTAGSPVTDRNTIALHCEPRIHLQNYSITFDRKGQIQCLDPVPGTDVMSGPMYDNATVSLGQFNKVFAAIPQSYISNSTYDRKSYITSYDWAGFLVARLYRRRDPGFTSLNPHDLMDMSKVVYQWVYSTYFTIWRGIYLQPLEKPHAAPNSTVIYNTWTMEPSIPSLAIALMVIALDTLIVLIVFGARRGRFKGPRVPRSIGAVMPWIAHSRMLDDFRGTYFWTSIQRRIHLDRLNKRYGFRMFLNADGHWRYAVDEEPPEDKAAGGFEDGFKMSGAIQLRDLGTDTTHSISGGSEATSPEATSPETTNPTTLEVDRQLTGSPETSEIGLCQPRNRHQFNDEYTTNTPHKDIMINMETETQKISVLLYGLGAIGSFYAFILHRSHRVRLTVVARSNYKAVIENGIYIDSANHGQHRFHPDLVIKSPAEVTHPYHYIVCANKAIDQDAVAAQLAPAVDEHTTFVIIQNGVGNEEPFRRAFPACSILTCVTWVGATQTSPGVITHIKSEDLQIGLFPNSSLDGSVENSRLDEFTSFLTAGGTKFQVVEDMQLPRWEKVVWNAAWNSITALTMVDTRTWLSSSADATPLTRRLMGEVIAVGRGCGVDLDEGLVDRLMDKINALPGIGSSMQTDCRNGRPMEIEVILGVPLRRAKELGIDTPVLETLTCLLRAVDGRFH
ncbi:putative 2-dehydropantoate 2-reductase [Aspergillus udagawae]|nr:putative 2-dehydropantoate 2-reductase [Aspergillus udagawae]